jgi:acetylornithine/N-succinyldiaminopimelate aminotransferase
VGAMEATKEVAKSLVPGSHASTFGGNPLACAASAAVFEVIESEGLLDNTTKMGNYSLELIRSMAKELDVIKEVRGIGLMIGIELNIPAAEVVKKCMDEGLLLNCTHDSVIRVMPQLSITKKYIDEGLGILKNILKSVN